MIEDPACKNRGGAVDARGCCLFCVAEAGETCREPIAQAVEALMRKDSLHVGMAWRKQSPEVAEKGASQPRP